MSDSESLVSQTETEESTDHEDVVEQYVQPYQYEPVADSDYKEEETDEDGIMREVLEARFNKNVAVSSW